MTFEGMACDHVEDNQRQGTKDNQGNLPYCSRHHGPTPHDLVSVQQHIFKPFLVLFWGTKTGNQYLKKEYTR